MKIEIYNNESNPNASTYYRLELPSKFMNIPIKHDIFQFKGVKDKIIIIKNIDIFEFEMLIKFAKESQIWIDFDDDVFNQPEHHPGKDGLFKEKFERLLKDVTGIITTNQYLKQKLMKYNDNIYVIPNFIDKHLWLNIPNRPRDEIRIGWHGSPYHIKNIELISNVIARLSHKYRVVLWGMSHLIPPSTWNLNNIECYGYSNYKFFPVGLKALGIDVFLCPLDDSEFSECKSGIKVLESILAGGNVIASKVKPFTEIIKNDDYLVEGFDENEWVHKIEKHGLKKQDIDISNYFWRPYGIRAWNKFMKEIS